MKKLSLFLVLLFFSSIACAQRRGEVLRIDGTISVARVNNYIEYCHHRQYKENWCWAACVQMVLDYYGLDVYQTSIVKRAYGDEYNVTANKNDIVRAINGWYISGSVVNARYERYKNAKTLIDAISSGQPLIVGLNEDSSVGHAYVLTHIFFKNDYNGNMSPIRVVLINPANNGDLEESLDWTEFYNRINTIISITKN